MSLKETLEELKEQEAKAIEAEAKQMETDIKAEEAPEVEPSEEEPAPEPEKVVEPPKVETETPVTPPEEDKPVDESSYGRLRREKAAAKRRADALEEEVAKLKEQLNAPKAVETVDYEPQSIELPQDIQEMRHERMRSKAESEFMGIEKQFMAKTADYEDVSKQYTIALAQSIRVQNPRLSMDKVADMTKEQILKKASVYFGEGLDPAEELYHEAKELGFKALPKEPPKVETETPEEPKVDLDKLAANKKRNAGMAGSNGRGAGGQVTMRAAADFTPREWAALPKDEKKRLLNGG